MERTEEKKRASLDRDWEGLAEGVDVCRQGLLEGFRRAFVVLLVKGVALEKVVGRSL